MRLLKRLFPELIPSPGLSIIFWTGITIVVLCLASIIVAEWFMPENAAGRQGVITFYRVFGTFALIEGITCAWVLGMKQAIAATRDTPISTT